MAYAFINDRLDVPEQVVDYWAGAVGANVDLRTGTLGGWAARAILIGTLPVAGTLVLTDISGNVITYNVAKIQNLNYLIRGNWIAITAAGSTAYDLQAWW